VTIPRHGSNNDVIDLSSSVCDNDNNDNDNSGGIGISEYTCDDITSTLATVTTTPTSVPGEHADVVVLDELEPSCCHMGIPSGWAGGAMAHPEILKFSYLL
jgi:hypothetical protein